MIKEKVSCWKCIDIPVYIMLLWSLISLLFMVYRLIPDWVMQVLGYLITVVVFGLVAFIALRSDKSLGFCAKAGAAAGAISGIFSAILNILSLYVFPVFHNRLLQEVMENLPPEAKETVTMEQIATFYKVGMYVTLITSPLVMGLIGLVATVLIALILKATVFRKDNTEKPKDPNPKEDKEEKNKIKAKNSSKKTKKKAKKQ